MIKYLCLIIMSTPVPIDQGLLSILNSKLPGCEFNTRLAQWFSSTGAAISVPKGTPCPTGYTAVPAQSYMASDATWQACGKNSATEQMPQSYADGVRACQNPSSVAPITTPTKLEPVNWFPIILIISIIVLILGALALYFMNKTSPIIRS